MSTEDTHYHILRLLEAHPEASQRELAAAMGVSPAAPIGLSDP